MTDTTKAQDTSALQINTQHPSAAGRKKASRRAAPQHLDHSAFGPLFSPRSETLILGSFPSVKSREAAFYYGHPQNRFWRILRALYEPEAAGIIRQGGTIDPPSSLNEKKALILDHGLALWDTICSCTITGSSDSSIRDVVPCDIPSLMQNCRIRRIFCNGGTSYTLYLKYCLPAIQEFCAKNGQLPPSVTKLPSTSPANAAWSLKKLLEAWKIVAES